MEVWVCPKKGTQNCPIPWGEEKVREMREVRNGLKGKGGGENRFPIVNLDRVKYTEGGGGASPNSGQSHKHGHFGGG